MFQLLNRDHHIISRGDELYPDTLVGALGSGAPKRLHCLGNLDLFNGPGLGFCGSRKASPQGLAVAQDCAAQAAEMDINVVSGNAAGVDFEAHYRALESGGRTILVLPEGICNFRVRKALNSVWDWDRVLVVSQFEPEDTWQAFRAMARNKIIIGLSGAMIVIEAGERGGTLAAGRSAIDMGVPLFVARYETVSEDAKGNEVLLDMGGTPLNRSKSTMRANMSKVRNAIFDPAGFLEGRRLI
ncbi:DNA-processing protein DprA [Frigidibacter sp.]|uniref:DNA-processing protein DprA n=1 Tax=Frigidibacter sp. TaxID=2586418 RepID=UPI002732EA6B|nr:DNA-processing protein DprA [Frigidibacter sp.]MDP3340752.1 DNA-processing protein DprA [Frigidibacter sp.]